MAQIATVIAMALGHADFVLVIHDSGGAGVISAHDATWTQKLLLAGIAAIQAPTEHGSVGIEQVFAND